MIHSSSLLRRATVLLFTGLLTSVAFAGQNAAFRNRHTATPKKVVAAASTVGLPCGDCKLALAASQRGPAAKRAAATRTAGHQSACANCGSDVAAALRCTPTLCCR